NKTFIDDAINQIKNKPDLLNKVCIASKMAYLNMIKKGHWQ
ncbi:TPA: cell division inhibition protein DicB, partial [Escherichia coli]|nr:cell division inhibition protein DicB [Escherichia coli]